MNATISKRLHILGRKNHGKTTLVVQLVSQLSQRGLRVGTIKHTHHQHELDTPGKDSHRHREAGAECVGILTPSWSAAFWGSPPADAGDERYESFAPMMAKCDLVLVEGDTQTRAAKIEVWRAAVGSDPIAAQDDSVLAVVSDDVPRVNCPIFGRENLDTLIAWILARR